MSNRFQQNSLAWVSQKKVVFDIGLGPLVTTFKACQLPSFLMYFKVVSFHFVDEGAALWRLRASFIPPGDQGRASLLTSLAQGPGDMLTLSRVSFGACALN